MNVLMPQLGETVAEGKITKWLKSAGEAIKPGDNLFEIETDKVSMEVPSTVAGVLSEIRVPQGQVAPVGAVVAVIADGAPPAADDTAAATPSLAKGPPASSAPPATPAAPSGDARPITLDPFFEVRTPRSGDEAFAIPLGTERATAVAMESRTEPAIGLSFGPRQGQTTDLSVGLIAG